VSTLSFDETVWSLVQGWEPRCGYPSLLTLLEQRALLTAANLSHSKGWLRSKTAYGLIRPFMNQ
jgi:hypothetical protein